MHKQDFSGNGRGELLVSSGWGIGAIGDAGGGRLSSTLISQGGTSLGAWRLDAQHNRLGPAGRFDGDTRSSTLIRSGWGIGILKGASGGFTSIAMAGNGTVVTGPELGGDGYNSINFTVNTAIMRVGPAGDFEGDCHDAFLAFDQSGIAALRILNGALTASAVAPFDSVQPGGWTVSSSDWFGPVGDYDGDGKQEVVVVGPWGMAVIRFSRASQATLAMFANGAAIGGWKLDVTQDQFGPAGDFDGDGHDELLVFNTNGFALLKMVNNALTSVVIHKAGDWVGGWHLGGGDRLGPAADFNGDGRVEVLLSSGWGIGVMAWEAGGWSTYGVTGNGAALGQWRLDTGSNRLNIAADCDGDGKAELLVSSNWGMGLLDLSGAPISKTALANGTDLGQWRLDTIHDDLELGTTSALSIILYYDGSDSTWKDAVASLQSALLNRGTTVLPFQDTSIYLQGLQGFAAVTAPGDRLLIYLGVHGDSPREAGDMSSTPCDGHGLEATHGYVKLGSMSPSFRAIANRGCDLIVYDGSCEGGETVMGAAGQRYCAVATTGVNGPGLTDTPDLGQDIAPTDTPSVFGTWWTSPHIAASRNNGQILMAMAHSSRIHQRLYRNDGTACTALLLFARGAMSTMTTLTPWWIQTGNCYLYPIIWPSSASGYSQTWTATSQEILANASSYVDPWRPTLTTYAQTVLDVAYSPALATTYANNLVTIWQCLVDDGSWDPGRQRSQVPECAGQYQCGPV